MSVQISWYDDDRTIILYMIQGQWTLQEVIEAKVAFDAAENPQTDYYIVNMQEAGAIPEGTLARRETVFQYFNRPNTLTVVVQGNRLMQWMVDMMRRLGLVNQFVFVDSMQAAENQIQQHRRQRAG
jgi:hypothetical protein